MVIYLRLALFPPCPSFEIFGPPPSPPTHLWCDGVSSFFLCWSTGRRDPPQNRQNFLNPYLFGPLFLHRLPTLHQTQPASMYYVQTFPWPCAPLRETLSLDVITNQRSVFFHCSPKISPPFSLWRSPPPFNPPHGLSAPFFVLPGQNRPPPGVSSFYPPLPEVKTFSSVPFHRAISRFSLPTFSLILIVTIENQQPIYLSGDRRFFPY